MKKTLIVFASLLLLSGAGWSDDLQPNANEAKYYDNAKVVRVKTMEGEGFVQRSYDDGNEEATANLPLFEKDTVGTTDGRMSIYLGRLNYLRLDVDTAVILEKVPALRRTDLAVRLEEGSIFLDIENLDQEKSIEVQTPDCGIFLLAKGAYRINADGERTEVLVLEGVAEVAGRDSGRNVRENQKIVMGHGEMTERPYYFYASEKDDFDRWNEQQNSELGYARYGSSRYLQGGYEDDEYEMSRSGRWTYMSEFSSYVWCPYNIDADWMPYANGRWVWNPYYGYVWVSYDPCGWFTHHYGRWHWSYAHGWHWIPSYHWSPAWVSWFWNDSHYGWCPLSWWNRPVVIIHDRWDRHYDYHRGIPHHSRSTIIIRKHELSAANMRRVAVSKATLKQDGLIAYRGSAPGERLESGKVTVINARGRSLTYKQGAIVSSDKYRTQGSDIRSAVYRYDAAPTGFKSVRRAVKPGDAAPRAKSAGESSERVRYVSSAKDSSGTRVYRSQSGDSGESGTGVARKSDSSGGSSYRSRSGSSSSSSGGSSRSGGTAVRKKKSGEPSTLSYSSPEGGPSGSGAASASTGAAAAARYTSRAAAGGRVVYRSFGSAAGGETAAAAGRRFIGTIVSSGSGTAAATARDYGSYRSRAYESDGSDSAAGAAASAYGSGGRSSGRAYGSGSSSSSSGSRSWSSAAAGVSRSDSGSSRAYGSSSHASSVSRHSSSSSSSSGSHHSSGSSSSSSGRAVKKN